MANVFLSYDHDDQGHARPLVIALEKAGHSVWWDQQISGGAQFNAEIESAVERCDAVIVLWSKRSVKSAWVRDEASEGRDAGKLIPVNLDGAKPPMGFRQYQTIDLSRWTAGRRVPKLDQLLSAIERQASDEGGKSSLTPASPRSRITNGSRVKLLGVAAVMVAAVAWVTIKGHSSSHGSVVTAVVPGDTSPTSLDQARDLLAKLGQFRSTTAADVELVSASKKKRADLIFEVSGSPTGPQLHANVVLLDGQTGRLFWSKDVDQPAAKSGDLREQLAVSAGTALKCALDTYSGGKALLKPSQITSYVTGCTELGDPSSDDQANLVPVFRKLVGETPRFLGGWSKLLSAEITLLGNTSDAHTAEALRRQITKDIAAARLINPQLSAAYSAEINLLPAGDLARDMQLIDRSVARNPNDPDLLIDRSGILHGVGRLNDSVTDARRALELDPLTPDVRANYIYTLAGSGRLDAALEQLSEADKLWPGSSSVQRTRAIVHNRYGDPKLALQMLRLSGGQSQSGAAETFLQARIDPSASNVARALEDARSAYRRSPDALVHLIQVLNQFDRQDELLALMARVPLSEQARLADLFFRPAGREFWRDPRSLSYAKRIGLLKYWSSSGKWPDFCFEREQPYDCRAEAKKIL